jgi:hypothetical protein
MRMCAPRIDHGDVDVAHCLAIRRRPPMDK